MQNLKYNLMCTLKHKVKGAHLQHNTIANMDCNLMLQPHVSSPIIMGTHLHVGNPTSAP